MKLSDSDITTREVLEWKGLHLLNFSQSSCSQKVRIFLAEKGIDYQSREIDIKAGDNTTAWFLGINPRGVVPVLVHDGEVHIESNDILRYLEETFPTPGHAWIPDDPGQQEAVGRLLKLEDDLHNHLRTVTMGFLVPQKAARKSEATLEAYAANGVDDAVRAKQVAWWRQYGEHGITETQARETVVAFREAFCELEALLGEQTWLLGDKPTVLDVAWYITLYRVVGAGYPIEVHPLLHPLYQRMSARPAFRRDLVRGPIALRVLAPLYRRFRRLQGTTLRPVYTAVFGLDAG